LLKIDVGAALAPGLPGRCGRRVDADLGLFARASVNDGRNENLNFTDIDGSVSGGLSLKGAAWGRPQDTVGVGAAANRISTAHRAKKSAGPRSRL
jgi:carbohydrate-selective porin OprB